MLWQAVIRLELDLRLHPELRFPLSRLDMDMHPAFLAREEEHSNAALSEDRRAHVVPAPNGQPFSGEPERAKRATRVRWNGMLGVITCSPGLETLGEAGRMSEDPIAILERRWCWLPTLLNSGTQYLVRARNVAPHGDRRYCAESRGAKYQGAAAPGDDCVVSKLILDNYIADDGWLYGAGRLTAAPADHVR